MFKKQIKSDIKNIFGLEHEKPCKFLGCLLFEMIATDPNDRPSLSKVYSIIFNEYEYKHKIDRELLQIEIPDYNLDEIQFTDQFLEENTKKIILT